MKKSALILLLAVINRAAFCQVNVTNHTAINPAWYVGWDNSIPSSTVPLVIQHLGQQPIWFRVNDQNLGGALVRRMELTVGQEMLENQGTQTPTDGLRIWNPGYTQSVGYNPLEALDLWTG